LVLILQPPFALCFPFKPGKKLTKGFYRCFADADQGSYDMFEIAEDAEEQQEILHELGDLQSFFLELRVESME